MGNVEQCYPHLHLLKFPEQLSKHSSTSQENSTKWKTSARYHLLVLYTIKSWLHTYAIFGETCLEPLIIALGPLLALQVRVASYAQA